MRTVSCEQCDQSLAQNSTLKVFDRVLCEPCATKDIETRAEIPEGSILREQDPTVCGVCAHDAGSVALETIGGVPVCPSCEANLRNRPFPLWVKAALAAVLALTIFAMVRNYRFFHGYYVGKQADRAAANADFVTAAKLLTAAAASVPEAKSYRAGAKFFEGLSLMQQDRSADALPLFQQVVLELPDEAEQLKELILQAEVGVAFDKKDYATMVQKTQAMTELHPDRIQTRLAVASAYACQYAASGDNEARRKAVERLQAEEERADLTDDDKKYLNRIKHRLATREIITSKEFEQRFPEGWKEGN